MPNRRWMFRCGMAGLVLTAVSLATMSLEAQQLAANGASASAPRTVQRETAAAASPLDTPLSIELRDVPLQMALNEIVRLSGVRVSYSPLVIPGERRVSVSGRNITLAVALQRVLAGTATEARLVAGGQVVIVRQANAGVEQGVILGKVVNAKTKQPLAGVTVLLDDATKGVVTSDDGTFRITAAVGEHTVHVRGVGFVRQNKKVTVASEQVVAVEFPMEASASVLDEVIVTGTVVATERKAIPTPITVITAADLEKRNVTRIDQLFRGEVPGVVALELGSVSYSSGNINLGNMQKSYIYSRGSSTLNSTATTPIKTFIDGVELLDPSYLGTIDPKSIERIEIVTGPQAATIYGSGAMGGVMQIFTKRGSGSTKPDVTLSLKYGMLESNLSNKYTPDHNDALLVTGGTGPEFSYSVNGTYGYQGQWQPGLYYRTMGFSAGMTHKRGNVQIGGSVGVTKGENGSLGQGGYEICRPGGQQCYSSAVARLLGDQGEIPASSRKAGTFDPEIAHSFAQQMAFDIDVRPVSFWQHHLTVGRSANEFRQDPRAPTFVTTSDTLFWRFWADGARVTGNYNTTLSARAGVMAPTLTLTGNYSAGKQSQYYGCTLRERDMAYVGCFSGLFGVYSTVMMDDRNWGGAGLFRVAFWDKLFFSFALRGERNPNYGSDHKVDWTPTQGVTYTMERGDLTLKLLASYGSATRAPTSTQRGEIRTTPVTYATPGSWIRQFANPDLTPEHSGGPEGGFELYYGNRGSITLNRYDQRVSDLIQYVPVDSTQIMYEWSTTPSWITQNQNRNTATVRQHGWETTASLNLGPLSLKGTYTLAEARTLKVNPLGSENGVRFNVGESRIGQPSHYGNFMASYAYGPTSVTWSGNWIGSSIQYNNFGVAAFVDGYARIAAYKNRTDYYWAYSGATPGYLKQNLAASHRLSGKATLTLDVTNLSGDYGSDNSVLFPSLGRKTQLGMQIRFM